MARGNFGVFDCYEEQRVDCYEEQRVTFSADNSYSRHCNPTSTVIVFIYCSHLAIILMSMSVAECRKIIRFFVTRLAEEFILLALVHELGY